MSTNKTYTEADARDWQRAIAEKDAEIATMRAALAEVECREDQFRRLLHEEKSEAERRGNLLERLATASGASTWTDAVDLAILAHDANTALRAALKALENKP